MLVILKHLLYIAITFVVGYYFGYKANSNVEVEYNTQQEELIKQNDSNQV